MQPTHASFDTAGVALSLRTQAGLNTDQSAVTTRVFSLLLDDSLDKCIGVAISKQDYERNIYLHKIDITQLKTDIQQSQSNDSFSSLLAHEQLIKEINVGRLKIREKLSNLKSELRLEMALEKGRMRDALIEADLKYQDLYSKIDAETSNGFAFTEKLRHDLFYSMSGFFLSGAAVLLGFLRYYG